MPRFPLIAAVLCLAPCAAPRSPPVPVETGVVSERDHERQLVLRRVELYAGGLTGDPAIALEQMAKREETLALAQKLPPSELPVRDLRAALAVFDRDVKAAADLAVDRLTAALRRTEGVPDVTAPLEDALLQVQILRAVYGAEDARYRDAAKAYADVAAAYPDTVLPTSARF